MPIGFHRRPTRHKKLNPPLNLATPIALVASRSHLLRRPESLATQRQRGSRNCRFLNSREPDPETHNQEKKVTQNPKFGFSSISFPEFAGLGCGFQVQKQPSSTRVNHPLMLSIWQILAKTGDQFQSPAKLANEVTNRRRAGMLGMNPGRRQCDRRPARRGYSLTLITNCRHAAMLPTLFGLAGVEPVFLHLQRPWHLP